MTHWFKYSILLLIPIVFGCGSNSSDSTQNDTEKEGSQISDVGDTNGDDIQDSVVLCDSLVTSNKKEMTASKMSVIDNDTMLKMEAVNENGTSLKLCFMKKGLSQKVINAIKHDFLNSNLRKRKTDIIILTYQIVNCQKIQVLKMSFIRTKNYLET